MNQRWSRSPRYELRFVHEVTVLTGLRVRMKRSEGGVFVDVSNTLHRDIRFRFIIPGPGDEPHRDVTCPALERVSVELPSMTKLQFEWKPGRERS